MNAATLSKAENGNANDDGLLGEVRQLQGERTVEDRVVEELRGLIVSGALRPGTRLRYRELATRLGVSPTPIRVALNRLEQQGLVAIDRHGRAAISQLTKEEFQELSLTRIALEGLLAKLGAEALDSDALEPMRAVLRELKAGAAATRTHQYLLKRWEFCAICYRAARRPRLLSQVERLFWRAERYNHILFSGSPNVVEPATEFHERFMARCADHDGPGAEQTIRSAIEWSMRELMPSLPSEALPPAEAVG